MWTRPLRAVSSAKAMVAAGTVKSMRPSALASSGATSAPTLTPFVPRPASSPASRPITAEPAASTAPASATPSVAAMAWISVRPMRPPAPATISRMSDMGLLHRGRGIAGQPNEGKLRRSAVGRIRQYGYRAGRSRSIRNRAHAPAILLRRVRLRDRHGRRPRPPRTASARGRARTGPVPPRSWCGRRCVPDATSTGAVTSAMRSIGRRSAGRTSEERRQEELEQPRDRRAPRYAPNVGPSTTRIRLAIAEPMSG